MCKGWAAAAGRLMTSLKPESLDGAALAARFPYLRALDLSHCLHTVTFHTQCAFSPLYPPCFHASAMPPWKEQHLVLVGSVQVRSSQHAGCARVSTGLRR